jgi:hypothetical protein
MDRISSPGREHHADMWIEPLPWFGTTWYERGPAYWWRRAAVTLVMLGGAAILVPLAYAVLAGLYKFSPVALVLAVAVMVSTGIWTAVWMWRHWWADVPAPSRRATGAAAAGGAAVGLLARAGVALGAVALAIGSALLLAPLLVLLVISFFPQLPPERMARLRLEHRHGRAAG